jgi:TATA-box binding protein (TBP) (component of TFIID and TFIIIB)
MKPEIVCANYRGSVDKCIDLSHAKLLFKHSRLVPHPHQLVIYDLHGKLIVFSTGKFRLMGCRFDDDVDAMIIAYKYFTQINKDIVPTIQLQSMTMKCKFEKRIRLAELSSSKLIKSSYEPEIIPHLSIQEFKPVKINVFETGSVILCGLKSCQQAQELLDKIEPLLRSCSYVCC